MGSLDARVKGTILTLSDDQRPMLEAGEERRLFFLLDIRGLFTNIYITPNIYIRPEWRLLHDSVSCILFGRHLYE